MKVYVNHIVNQNRWKKICIKSLTRKESVDYKKRRGVDFNIRGRGM